MTDNRYDEGVRQPQPGEWVIARAATSWESPGRWEIGRIEAIRDQYGINRTMIHDHGERVLAEPSIRYVIPEQVVGVYPDRATAMLARGIAKATMAVAKPIHDAALKALHESSFAVVIGAARGQQVA